MLAVGAYESAHVLGQAQDANARLAAKVELLAHVEQRHLLRRGDDDGAVDAALFEKRVYAQVLVAGARRRVDEHKVQVAPLHVLEELLDQAVLLGPAPDDGLVAAGQHELDAHDGQVVHDPDGRPAGAADVYGLVLDAHHLGYARAANVRVHDADVAVRVGRQGVREQRRKGALADAALAAEDEDLVLDILQARRDDGDVGVGTLGRRRADGLVRAPRARVCRAGLLRLGPGTVLRLRGDELRLLFEGVGENVVDRVGLFEGRRHCRVLREFFFFSLACRVCMRRR